MKGLRRTVLARAPLRPRARLALAPRLHANETLTSWLERFAGAYGMTVREFVLWLGYPDLLGYAQAPYDLDVSQPPDLAAVLGAHAGLDAQRIAAHRMRGSGALPPERRRVFCPECWAEEGAYRRFEWARGWSLVCPRHRRVLRERPRPKGPLVRWHEESWSEFYRDASAWGDLRPSWQSEEWQWICANLGVDPHAEFLRAWPWLLELSGAPNRRSSASEVKQDLALYGMIRFWQASLLQALDASIAQEDLMTDTSGGHICDVRTPDVPHRIRLLAGTVARHLWVRLTEGHWRCGRHETLERVLNEPGRWNDEEWWLEQRLRTWPVALQASGRELFRRTDPFVQLPPWERCRQCVRGVDGAVREVLSICLPESWHCLARDASVEDALAALLGRYSSVAGDDRRFAARLDCTAPD